jgi:hypothetical protein
MSGVHDHHTEAAGDVSNPAHFFAGTIRTANPNPASAGDNVTLTSGNITDGNPGATISSVTFYYFDATGAKQVLGTGTANGDGTWSLTFSTAGWAAGSYTIYAQATDSAGVTGDPFALTLQLI